MCFGEEETSAEHVWKFTDRKKVFFFFFLKMFKARSEGPL